MIIEEDIIRNLKFKIFEKQFDIVFMDPPYKDKNLSLILSNIIDSDILGNNGIIILHRHKKEKDKLPNKFKVLEEKTYGISKIIFGNFC